MNKVNDSEKGYAVNRKTTALAELIGDILGSPKAGQRMMSELVSSEEEATNRNVRDRLQLALSADKISGITAKQTLRLRAVKQLIEQLYFAELQVGAVVDHPGIAAKAFQAMGWQPIEQFAVLSMDCKHRILSQRIISSGTATETFADPKEIFRTVILAGGTRCIVAHNHPSGSLEPSPEDLVLTKQLLQGSKTLAIPIMDHLIVSRGEFTSIRQTTDLWTKCH